MVQDNQAIAALSDYILSNNIISRVLAMVAERREIKAMFDELLGPDGQEVSVTAASKYVRDREILSFYDLFLRTRAYGEVRRVSLGGGGGGGGGRALHSEQTLLWRLCLCQLTRAALAGGSRFCSATGLLAAPTSSPIRRTRKSSVPGLWMTRSSSW